MLPLTGNFSGQRIPHGAKGSRGEGGPHRMLGERIQRKRQDFFGVQLFAYISNSN